MLRAVLNLKTAAEHFFLSSQTNPCQTNKICWAQLGGGVRTNSFGTFSAGHRCVNVGRPAWSCISSAQSRGLARSDGRYGRMAIKSQGILVYDMMMMMKASFGLRKIQNVFQGNFQLDKKSYWKLQHKPFFQDSFSSAGVLSYVLLWCLGLGSKTHHIAVRVFQIPIFPEYQWI